MFTHGHVVVSYRITETLKRIDYKPSLSWLFCIVNIFNIVNALHIYCKDVYCTSMFSVTYSMIDLCYYSITVLSTELKREYINVAPMTLLQHNDTMTITRQWLKNDPQMTRQWLKKWPTNDTPMTLKGLNCINSHMPVTFIWGFAKCTVGICGVS